MLGAERSGYSIARKCNSGCRILASVEASFSRQRGKDRIRTCTAVAVLTSSFLGSASTDSATLPWSLVDSRLRVHLHLFYGQLHKVRPFTCLSAGTVVHFPTLLEHLPAINQWKTLKERYCGVWGRYLTPAPKPHYENFATYLAVTCALISSRLLLCMVSTTRSLYTCSLVARRYLSTGNCFFISSSKRFSFS